MFSFAVIVVELLFSVTIFIIRWNRYDSTTCTCTIIADVTSMFYFIQRAIFILNKMVKFLVICIYIFLVQKTKKNYIVTFVTSGHFKNHK